MDYPDIGADVGARVVRGEAARGIVVCGTGIGISIAANKVDGVRCALCHDYYTALMARHHNNANVLALGGRTTGIEVAKQIVETFLTEQFDGGRHQRRLDKIPNSGGGGGC